MITNENFVKIKFSLNQSWSAEIMTFKLIISMQQSNFKKKFRGFR